MNKNEYRYIGGLDIEASSSCGLKADDPTLLLKLKSNIIYIEIIR